MIKDHTDIKVGQRVKVKGLNIKGTIEYIHYPDLYNHHLLPIQIKMDDRYGDSDSKTYRASLKELVIVRKGVRRNGKKKSS